MLRVVRAISFTPLPLLVIAALLSGCPPTPCCTVDADCGDGRMCVDDVCTIPCASDEGCREDEVCAATRSSDGSGRFCVRPGGYPTGTCPDPSVPDAGGPSDGGDADGGSVCSDDGLEPNDARTTPSPLVGDSVAIRGLSICSGDEDWFVVDLAPGETALIEISFINADGDLDLYGFVEGSDTPFLTSTSTEDTEFIDVPGSGGRFTFQVFGWNGATNPSYGLSFTRTGIGPCLDDNEPNDTLLNATVLPDVTGFGTIAGGICSQNDVDLFRVDHAPGDAITSTLGFLPGQGELDLLVLDAEGVTVAESVFSAVGKTVTTGPLATSPHFLAVYSPTVATNTYTLSYSHPSVAACGDGFIQEGEQCDDGNTINGDGCSSSCALEFPSTWTCPVEYYADGICDCGCGVLDPDCPSLSADVCEFNNCPNDADVVVDDNTRCSIPGCGDGVVTPPVEECDDGNLIPGDGCSASCQDEPRCGNGLVEPPFEQCDDGNLTSGDGCSSFCAIEVGPLCGDGALNPGEQCDDGNLANGDGCSSVCTFEVGPLCGNGTLDFGEQCDDGNLTNFDGCSSTCVIETPGQWTCEPSYYGTDDGCDCGCGILDPDCPSLSSSACDYNNCTSGTPLPNNNPLCAVAVCGNGVLQPGEQCDDGNLVPGDGCSPQCTIENMGLCGNGALEPGEQCDDGNNAPGDGCSSFCTNEFPPTCGNGFLDGNEQCDDGNNVAGDGCSPFCTEEVPPTWTCPPWWYDSGGGCDCGCGTQDLDCESSSSDVCDYNNCPNGIPVVEDDNAQCDLPSCGNGFVDSQLEQCDDGNNAGGDGCSASCQLEIVCGNGTVEGFEQCDDGNLTGGDGCSPGCTLEFGVCGNGFVEPPFEECDDGNTTNGDGCSAFCTAEFGVCGNGVVEPPFEQCDDGNFVDGDGCSSFCTNEAPIGWTCPVFWYGDNLCDCGCAVLDVDCPSLSSSVCEFNNCPGVEPLPNNNPQCQLVSCGNFTIEPPEQCDDGNLTNGDGCNLNCQLEPACGNGFIEGFEQCDDGNTLDGDGCSSTCFFEQGECGNGVVEPPFEQCDDGNFIDGDGCSSFCFFEFNICGNGVVEEPFEQCDDGNTTDGDGCSSFCFFEFSVCGNGIVEQPFEQCDDGNTTDGDGCSSFCGLEGPNEWICAPEWFGDGICDCGCGATDIDCPATTVDVCQFNNCQAPQVVDPDDNSQCIDVTCADDFFEENDEPQSAAALATSTLTNAVLCPSDPDFFVFDAPADTDVTVVLQYTAPPQMTLRVSRPGIGIIDTVSGGGGNLVINFFSTTAGPVIVRVTGASLGAGVPRPYAVTAFFDDVVEECVDDALEPNNEPPGTGPLLLPADIEATSCTSDPDFFTMLSGGANAVTVDLTSPTSSDLLFAVFSVDFSLLATGTANAGAVDVVLSNPGAFVVVVAGGAGDAYALHVDAN
jgi:cysteine-rich repeat protein